MTLLRLKYAVKHNGIYMPPHVEVEVEDADVPALLELGAYDVKSVAFAESEVFSAEKPRKRGKK